MPPEPPAKKTFTLKPGIEEVARAGLILRKGQTVDLTPHEAEPHADVLEPAKAKRGGA